MPTFALIRGYLIITHDKEAVSIFVTTIPQKNIPMSHSPVILSIACPDQATARTIGTKLVEAKLVACAQVFPIHSIFRWEEKVQSEAEVMLQAKTLEEHVPAIEKLVVELHSYEVPEIIATPIVWGHQPYLDWIGGETK